MSLLGCSILHGIGGVHLMPSRGLEAQPSSIYLNLVVYFGTFSFTVARPRK
jgi:hypothetical protein